MARPFATKDAKKIIAEHRSVLNKLNMAIAMESEIKNDVVLKATSLVQAQALEVLKNIPVEEINRDKGGIKTKTLRDCGYETVADLRKASTREIEAIKGIGQESAVTIKGITTKWYNEVVKNIKISLSIDNKSPESTSLVKAICAYRMAQPLSLNSQVIMIKNAKEIQSELDTLSQATGMIKWFFVSGEKKQKAENAYNYLSNMLHGEYGADIQEIESSVNKIKLIDDSQAWKEFEDNSIQFFSLLESLVPGVVGTDDSMYGLPEEFAEEIKNQSISLEGLNCSLRHYQEWGVKYIIHQEKVLLGDEMGLGKTIQAIASMVSLRNEGGTHFVVVCPASVVSNWCREIGKHSDLKPIKVHGSSREEALELWIKEGGVAVTTYETTKHFVMQDGFKFSMCVVDEAHYIKNPEAQRTKNVRNICKKADRMLFMTGTALENNVDEMIELIEVLQPDIALEIKEMAYMSAAPQFRDKIVPVYYRRKREDVLTELPELIEIEEWCELTEQENEIYESTVLERNYANVRRVSWNVEDINDSTKASRMMEIIEEAESDGRKVIVFSFFLDTIGKITQLLGDKCLSPINGSVPLQKRQEIIDEFDKAPAGTVLAAQIQSGGTGLNIQSASVVILCEPQFKPSIENQAISRAYRMGQARNVLVYRLLCEDTVDEKITALLKEKQAIFDAFADESSAVEATNNFEIDEKSFGAIINEEIERINAKKEQI